MKKLHLAIATNDIAKTVQDYSQKLGCEPVLIIPNEYALWRNDYLNISIRQDSSCKPGELRHMGWEDPQAKEFTTSTDVNGILWESFSAEHQAEEIEEAWPGTGYIASNDS
jgi:catechol 2,3-dioxygenase-like lactoylglutathione lyase family enzyme